MQKISKKFASLGEKFFTYTKASPLNQPNLIHINREVQTQLGLNDLTDQDLLKITNGQKKFADYSSLATVYAGHQFGVFVPELGDGRALLIGECISSDGLAWELQLKGAGKTPYSRMGDGRAVLRSTIREYLASHAMHKLGVKTTQALAIIHSPQTPVYRENIEGAAIILRVAPSFIRFGHFELFASRNQATELKQLIEFIVKNYYPEIDLSHPEFIIHFLEQVIKASAIMVAKWQSIGFVHGVMNSDNMSILGLTLDYGPYAFMDSFRPEHAYNHSDSERRYSYARQAYIVWWNLYRLAEALSVIYSYPEQLEKALAIFSDYYNQAYTELIAKKLGFAQCSQFDLSLSETLIQIMHNHRLDWTYTWRKLSFGESGKEELNKIYKLGKDFENWYKNWQTMLNKAGIKEQEAYRLMQANNPALVLRNHLLQNAIIKAETGDYSEVVDLFNAISEPYHELNEYADYYALPPSWAEHIELSCSS